MALYNIIKPSSQVQNSQGAPLAGGYVYLYEPGTTTFITAYGDSDLVQPLTQPVRLSGSGRANIWITRNVDMFITDRNGNNVLQELNANPDVLGTDQGGGLVPNGSFEIETTPPVPDSWTPVNDAGSTNAVDSTMSTDGANSYRFTSSGVGGGSLTTSDFFPVNDSDPLSVNFDIQASGLGPLNIVRIEWYDVTFVSISNTDVYSSTATPAGVWTEFQLQGAPPALARFAKLKLIGLDASVPFAGSTWFDRISVFYPAIVSGVFDNITIQNNEIISTNLNGDINLIPDGTGAVSIGSTNVPETVGGNPATFSDQALRPNVTVDGYLAGNAPGAISFRKSRSGVVGTHTVNVANDDLGYVDFFGDTGVGWQRAARIAGRVDGTPGVGDMPGALLFLTVADGGVAINEHMRITQGGQLTVQSSSSYSGQYIQQGGINAQLAVMNTTAFAPLLNTATFDVYDFAGVAGPQIFIRKSRANGLGNTAIVASGDQLGTLTFAGDDGASAFVPAAAIAAFVDGAPGVGDMPGRLVFSTTLDGAAAVTERMRITNDGRYYLTIDGAFVVPPNFPDWDVQKGGGGSGPVVYYDSYSGGGPAIGLRTSANATIGTQTLVANGDPLGALRFYGSDGANFIEAAFIRVAVDDVPGVNDMPGRIEFHVTANGAATPTRRWKINNAGLLQSLTNAGVNSRLQWVNTGIVDAYMDTTSSWKLVDTTNGFDFIECTLHASFNSTVQLFQAGVSVFETQDPALTGSSFSMKTGQGGGIAGGFNGVPVYDRNVAYTFNVTEVGMAIRHTDGTARIYTTDSNVGNVPTSSFFQVLNAGTGLVTVAAGAGITLSWYTGAAVSTGSRTLAQGAVATLIKQDATNYIIYGSGIT